MKHQNVDNKIVQTTSENVQKQLCCIKERVIRYNATTLNIPKSEESLNWGKVEKLPFQIEVFFSRPMKNIEYEKIDENAGYWSAYYNVQLPTIVIENSNQGFDHGILLKVVQVTQLKGEVIKVTELVGEDSQFIQSLQRTELKGLKLNTPQKLQNKKRCIHHIAICAFKQVEESSCNNLELIGLSICGGFSLKSRKKSHQEKGLDTSYFKPIELTQSLLQRKCKQQPIMISNNIEGLLLYFTSPNIRHKIIHPLFLSVRFSQAVKLYLCSKTFPAESDVQNKVKKICTEFSKCQTGNEIQKNHTMEIMIDDTSYVQGATDKEDQVQRKKKIQKVLKALECTKDSKCLYYLKSDQEETKERLSYYHFETQSIKDNLISIYKSIYQLHSGVNEKDWYIQDSQRTQNTSPSTPQIGQSKLNRKRKVSSVIDVNEYRKANSSLKKILYKIQVQYREETQMSTLNQESFKHMMQQNDEQQNSNYEVISQIISTPTPAIQGNQDINLEPQINIKYEAECHQKADQLNKIRYQNFVKQEENELFQTSTVQDQQPLNICTHIENSEQKMRQPQIKKESQDLEQQSCNYQFNLPQQAHPFLNIQSIQEMNRIKYQYQQCQMQLFYQYEQHQKPYYPYNYRSNPPQWYGFQNPHPISPNNQNKYKNCQFQGGFHI
ncbi:zinc finger transcription factor sma protein, putative (macronuclear) [Tetrahymena thermophila SB210]|uniref:Zinc finger transcription factor sma protein, putative n=1 Tax=Tetrahymena thermophila (strain SB210) TaxID=312017 RepID=I7MJK4_TETTS|nr:zinc finger transcription factor sma protein, putative [Tetrahymena thermophila SB210]EAS06692.2 zinc finger transcription factor sma protein, putative [Tetrahymena thermophila SB210]|eukprot:XP_001026934.2 zinc finger transcription factor sma protein, putative [Tetrahymena thermophila SB210]